jgi:tetratricopeptide (TPR) repeat protein
MNMGCRRVFAGALPEPTTQSTIPPYQWPFDSVRFCDQDFGKLDEVASELGARLSDKLAVATALERRIWAAFAKASSVADALLDATEWPACWDLAKRLAEAVTRQARLAPLRDLWSRLALFRGAMDADLVQELGAGHLEPDARTILDDGLLQPCNGGVELHDVLKQIPAQMRWQTWPLRQSTHERFAEYFARRTQVSERRPGAAIGDILEGFHHAASAGDATAPQQFKPFSGEQLHTLGRVLSKERGDHEAAIGVFEEALRLDDHDDYAHHYLAYNIDWLASDEDRADLEYKRAVELNRGHPWWWSRRINFLITTGRLNEARKNWHDATTSLVQVSHISRVSLAYTLIPDSVASRRSRASVQESRCGK